MTLFGVSFVNENVNTLRPLCSALAAALLLTASAQTQQKVFGGPPGLPAAAKGKQAVVLFFIAHDCPIANAYAPEMNRICAAYAPRKIAFYRVYAEQGLSAQAANKHAKDYGFRCPALLDPALAWARRIGATVTPEAAVLAPDGRLLYRGRIDDTYVDYGRRRDQPTTRDLRRALDAVLHGQPVPQRITKAVGCLIPRP